MNMLKAIIFDLDGTLIHSAPDIQFASNEALKSINRDPLDIETIISFIGSGSEVLVDRFIDFTGGGSDVLKSEVFTTFMSIYEKNISTLTEPYPGVVDALNGFRARGLKLGICTNKPNGLAKEICEDLDIAKYFDVIVGARACKPKKPDTYLLETCVNALKCKPDEVRYVGDSTIDFDTAMNASIKFYLFSGGYLNKPYPDLSKCSQFENWRSIYIS
ncbi:HAD-IA family hydrolase [Amylibacter sp.]|nr:HAD-IA family hydrolase [Amylibacter sp.]